MSNCPDIAALVETEIDRVLTQYRESPKLLHVIRTYLFSAGEVISAICDMPEHFDIDTAVGDQLTLLGKRLGWPRCHCVCTLQPVFGFECEGYPSDVPVSGFCDTTQTWLDCGPYSEGDICLEDDELYRKFLKVRRYQMLAFFDIDSLQAAIETFWGETAWIVNAAHDVVTVSPGRPLTEEERAVLQLYPRVLPIAPGIAVRFHFGTYMSTGVMNPIFGFGEGWGGFCEPWEDQSITLADGTPLATEDGTFIISSVLTRDADWMCTTDVHPYDCPGMN